MSILFYKFLHLFALLCLFLAFGGILFYYRQPEASKPRVLRMLMAAHGISLLVVLVSGFGMLAKLGINWPWPDWLIPKLVIWLFLGAALALVKRGPGMLKLMAVLIPVLGGVAVYFGLYH